MSRTGVSRRRCLQFAGAGAAALAFPAFAAYPEKTIKIVVTFAAGGASDIVARVVGEQLAKKLGQAVIVDNRPGAGGSVGGSAVVQSPADGYTLMLSNSTPISIGPFALEKQPYDPLVDFTHIASIGSAPCVVMANPASGINTLVDLENAARKSGQLQFGSGGPASIGHIFGELMVRTMGVKMGHVPYRGGAPMTTDLICRRDPDRHRRRDRVRAVLQERPDPPARRDVARSARRSCPTCRPSSRPATASSCSTTSSA